MLIRYVTTNNLDGRRLGTCALIVANSARHYKELNTAFLALSKSCLRLFVVCR